MTNVNAGAIGKVLDWAYELALDPGVPGVESAYDLARDYAGGSGTLCENVDSLIRWQNTKAGTSGFLSGLGGILTLPIAIPANISSVIYVQVRMIAAIAIMGGLDPRQDQVKSLVFACLCGAEAAQLLKQAGIRIGKKLTEQVIRGLSRELLKQINRAVGFRLVTKFGSKGFISLVKAVPLIGGVIGGMADLVSTDVIGGAAKAAFIPSAYSCSFAC
ncbi:MAG TPA: EcsC family protein [Candidatus Ozemobacteraceae bacterium]|nr:EcsC family protein [Candidatus Ozemobacteraceae bacterium]